MHAIELRWLVVFKRCQLNLPWDEIEEHLGIPVSTQKKIVACYEETNAVRRQTSSGRPRTLSTAETMALIKRVLDSPMVTIAQHRANLILSTGKSISIATLCRVLHENGFTRQKVAIRWDSESSDRVATDISWRYFAFFCSRCST
jgi:transposase